MKARAALATAPMRVMRPSRSGIPNANPAAEKERERGEFWYIKETSKRIADNN